MLLLEAIFKFSTKVVSLVATITMLLLSFTAGIDSAQRVIQDPSKDFELSSFHNQSPELRK